MTDNASWPGGGYASGPPPRRSRRWPWVLGIAAVLLAAACAVAVVFALIRPTAGGPITHLDADLLVAATAFPDSDGATVTGPRTGEVEPLDIESQPPECAELFHPPATRWATIEQHNAAGRTLNVTLQLVTAQPDLHGILAQCRQFQVTVMRLAKLSTTVQPLPGPTGTDPRSSLVRRDVGSLGDTKGFSVLRFGFFRGLYVEVDVQYDDGTDPTDADIAEVNRLFDEQIDLLRRS